MTVIITKAGTKPAHAGAYMIQFRCCYCGCEFLDLRVLSTGAYGGLAHGNLDARCPESWCGRQARSLPLTEQPIQGEAALAARDGS